MSADDRADRLAEELAEARALLANLASVVDIAVALGMSKGTVSAWTTRRPGFPKPVLVLGSRNVYDLREVIAWRNTRPPLTGGGSYATMNRSQDLDEVVVERAMAGEKVPLTLLELHTAIDRLTKAGLSQRAIAERLDVSERTVCRSRSGVVKYGRPQPVDGDVHRLSRELSTVALDSTDEQDAA